MNKKTHHIVLFLFILFSFDLNAQYMFLLEASNGNNETKYSTYKDYTRLYNYGVGCRYDLTKSFSIGLKINYLSFKYQIDGKGTHLKQDGKRIQDGQLINWLLSKDYSLNSNLRYKLYGFFTELGFGIGGSDIKTEWDYYFTDYKEIDTKQNFTDIYERILTYDVSFRLGYAYTYKDLISLGVYWERIKYFSKERQTISREGSYRPVDVFAPDAISIDPIIVNPNCYLWGILLEYHFPRKK